MRIFVTGPAGVGKTTLVSRVAREVNRWGYIVGGMITQEVRQRGRRMGFKITALDTDEEGTLAWIGNGRPRIGKYVVHVDELNRVGVSAIRRALTEADLIVIDEIGQMEYMSDEFVRVVGEVLKSEKPLLAAVHRRFADKFRPLGKLYTLSVGNRNGVFSEVRDEVVKELKSLEPK